MPHTNTPMLSLAAMEAKRLWPFVFGFAVYGGLIYKANAALTRTALFSTTLLHTHTDIYIYIYICSVSHVGFCVHRAVCSFMCLCTVKLCMFCISVLSACVESKAD